MVKEFNYNSKGEVRRRKVFVLHENEQYLEGLDLAYLTTDEGKKVQETLKDHVVGDIPPKGTKSPPVEGYDPEWNKAWRRFKKVSFLEDKDAEQEKKE